MRAELPAADDHSGLARPLASDVSAWVTQDQATAQMPPLAADETVPRQPRQAAPEQTSAAPAQPEAKIVSAALAAAEPEPLIEPEPPPTVAAEPQQWVGRWRPTTITFAYLNSHPVAPLTASAIETAASAEPWTDVIDKVAMPLDAQVESRAISRLGICDAIVSAARGNDLPIPFFANLIWQESNFHLGEISDAGALGVAQFVPETASEHGLINPFEPIHAIYTAGKLLRRLQGQYGNLGFAAAAYNAGPGRVNEWLVKHRALPAETRAYVIKITGHHAKQWASNEFRRAPESRLMPAKAPCAEVAAEVAAQEKFVRVANLMLELAAATNPPPPPANMAVVANAGAGTAKMVPLPRANPLVAAIPEAHIATVAAKPAPRLAAAAVKPAAQPVHTGSIPAPAAKKIAERAPTAPAPKTQQKPARATTLVERILGSNKTAAPPAHQTAAVQAVPKRAQVRKEAHSEKRQAVALEAAR